MKLLVTGVRSQLARSLEETASAHPGLQIELVGRPELDLAQPGQAFRVIVERQPDVVINAAAYTAVDQAESEPELVYRVNAEAAGEIAEAARSARAKVIQISTDYVFDGEAETPYTEDAATRPLNTYGRSKLAGEEQVRAANPDHLIVRTSWVYSPFGHNFVKTMLRLAGDREDVRVVSDQIGCPTNALDLAEALLIAAVDAGSWGKTYHLASPDPCSWADLADAVFAASRAHNGPSASVTPILTAEYPTRAPRPRYSALDSSLFAAAYGHWLPKWDTSVERVVERLVRR